FCFVPLLLVLYVSVHRWSPIEPTRAFVALANYDHVVRDPLVWTALGRTLLYALYVPVSIALALGLALAVGGRRRSGAPALRVTFRLLRPLTLFVLVTGIIGAFQVLALVMVLTGGGPLGATDVIVYRIYRTAWELLQFGDASAMTLLLFAVLFGVTWAQLKLL